MAKLLSILLTLLLSLVFSCDKSLGQTVNRYVCVTGTDSGDCTDPSSPCRSIQYAANRGGLGGGTIYVSCGEYSETINIVNIDGTIQGGWNETFSAKAIDPSSTIISGNGDDPVLNIGDSGINLKIQNFTIRNCGEKGCETGVFLRSLMNYFFTVTLSEAIITDCANGITFWAPNEGSIMASLENCIIEDNRVGVYASASGNGTMNVELTNSTIANNHRNKTSGWGVVLLAYEEGNITFESANNIIWGNSGNAGADLDLRQLDDADLTVTCSYSDLGVILNDGATYNDAGDNLNDDPLFVNPPQGNYRIRKNSPCKDAGICGKTMYIGGSYVRVRIAPYVDFEGDPRPLTYSPGCDIGADERLLFRSNNPFIQLLLLDDL